MFPFSPVSSFLVRFFLITIPLLFQSSPFGMFSFQHSGRSLAHDGNAIFHLASSRLATTSSPDEQSSPLLFPLLLFYAIRFAGAQLFLGPIACAGNTRPARFGFGCSRMLRSAPLRSAAPRCHRVARRDWARKVAACGIGVHRNDSVLLPAGPAIRPGLILLFAY